MKFGFENHVKTPEVKSEEIEKELSEEEKQQKFEEECIAEASKLKVSLGELKKDIDVMGGEEKFKEHFEKATGWSGLNEDGSMKENKNVAGDTQRGLERNINGTSDFVTTGKLAALVAGITILMNMIDTNNNNVDIDYNGMRDVIASIKEGSANAAHYVQGSVVLMMGSLTAFLGKMSLNERFEKRKLQREKKINDLKFKMTGTEVK